MNEEDLKKYIKAFSELNERLGKSDDIEDLEELESFNKQIEKVSKLLTENSSVDENLVNVNIIKVNENAVIPSYSKDGDAGVDLTITSIVDENETKIMYGFGIVVEIPKGYVGLLFPRSSVSKTDLIMANCVGVIDSGYRGEVMAVFKKTNTKENIYKIGERGAQLIILPYPKISFNEVKTISETERGDGGFGHSGK